MLSAMRVTTCSIPPSISSPRRAAAVSRGWFFCFSVTLTRMLRTRNLRNRSLRFRRRRFRRRKVGVPAGSRAARSERNGGGERLEASKGSRYERHSVQYYAREVRAHLPAEVFQPAPGRLLWLRSEERR